MQAPMIAAKHQRSSSQQMAPSGRRGTDTLERRIAPGAFHDSGRKYDPPKCQARTRNAILSMINTWLSGEQRDCGMLWLYGPGGAGKSAIAQTISQLCYERGVLAASFFFAKGIPGLNTEKHLMATIAHQISLSVPETRRFIAQAVESDPAVFQGTLETQLNTLIVNPLLHAFAERRPSSRRPARLVVIDGLDECQGANVQRYIVRILSTALIHRRVPLFILVSSRPEPPIRDSFNSYDLRELITTLVLDDAYLPDGEIKRFLWTKFDAIKAAHPLRTYIPPAWPSPQMVHALVQRAAGQFIYASTVVRYVDSPQHRPVERLDVVLRVPTPAADVPFAELDALYRHVLHGVHNSKGVLRILGAILFAQRLNSRRATAQDAPVPLPVTDPRFLEELLSLNRGDVSFLLSDLHALLAVPDSRRPGPSSSSATPSSSSGEGGIRILHSSLIDFLTDRARAGKHFINSVKAHADLARACARALGSGHRYVHQYAGQALVTHCRYAVLTHELAGDLAQFDVARWIDTCPTWADGGGAGGGGGGGGGGGSPYEAAWAELPLFFQWLRAQTYPDPTRDLAVHHERTWDAYLRRELVAYGVPVPGSSSPPSRYGNGHSGSKEAEEEEEEVLLGDVLPLATYPGLLWDWAHVWPLLGVPPAAARALEERDRDALHVTGLRQTFDAYRHMLAGFLGDERRAGAYVLGGVQYVRVAKRVARYLCEAKTPGKLYAYPLPSEWTWFRAEHDDKIYREKRAKETFQAGLQYLPFLLDRAAPDASLVSYLGEVSKRKTGVLDAVRTKELPRLAWAEDKVKAEEAVEAYLERCRSGVNGNGNGNGVNGSGGGEAMSVDEPS